MSEPQSLMDAVEEAAPEATEAAPTADEQHDQEIVDQAEQEAQEAAEEPEPEKEVPEEYTLNINEEYGDLGIQIDDPLVKEAMTIAQDAQLTQSHFDQLMDLYAQTRLQDQEAQAEYVQEQLKELGGYGKERIHKVSQWMQANVPENLRQGFAEMAGSARAFEALEHLIGLNRPMPIAEQGFGNDTADAMSKLNQMQFAVDQHGNRLMEVDMQYRKRVEELAEKIIK